MRGLKRFTALILMLHLLVTMLPPVTYASSESDLTFTLNGESYSVSGCNESAAGDFIIPATYNGKPVTSIGDSAFSWCESLTSITIPDSVTTIGVGAFEYCDSLTSITIPDSVTTIGDSAFSCCYGLTSVTIGNGVTSIGNSVFDWCDRLTSITIPDSVTTIGDSAFYWCESLTGIWVDDNNPGYSSDSSGILFDKNKTRLIQAPGMLDGSYTIPDSVTTIGDFAFTVCDSLTSITIPDSVTTIGDFAFQHCNSLTSITIPDSVTTIGDFAFSSCESLTSITIPDSVTSIGSSAFYRCERLTSITIPDSVTTIGDSAFECCSSLTSITIPDSVTTIGDSAFSCCYGLTSITIPDSVTTIGDSVFSSCESLTSVTIGNSVTTIGVGAFEYCTSLTSITIPDSVTSIGSSAFYRCESLTSITIPDSVTTIGDSAFSWCYFLTSVTIGNSVTTIGDSAFECCSSLTSITIPDSVTTIGDSVFSSCESLTSITIPDSVTTIGAYAFSMCDSLTDVYYSGTEVQWYQIDFGSCNDEILFATIHFEVIGSGDDNTGGNDGADSDNTVNGVDVTVSTYDFELYNNSALSGTITGDYDKYSKVKTAIDNAYANGTINWKLEGYSNEIPRFITDQGLRISTTSGDYVAIRFQVPKAGSYKVTYNSLQPYDFSANTWILKAPETAMSLWQISSAMKSSNAMKKIDLSTTSQTAVVGQYDFTAAGEYVLILQATDDRIYLGNITLSYFKEIFDESKAEIIDLDFKLYDNDAFSQTIQGNYEKYSKVKDQIEAAYEDGTLNWKLEGYPEETPPRFVKDQGLRYVTDSGNYISIRFGVSKSGTYRLDFTSPCEEPFGIKAWIVSAPEQPMTPAHIYSLCAASDEMIQLNISQDTLSAAMGICKLDAGEYVLILEATTNRLHLGNIVLTEVDGETDGIIPANAMTNVVALDFELYKNDAFRDIIQGQYEKYHKVKTEINDAYASSKLNWKLEGYSADLTPQFVENQGLKFKTNPGDYVAIRFKIAKAGNYLMEFNSPYSYVFGAKTWIAEAPDATMSPALIDKITTSADEFGDINIHNTSVTSPFGFCKFAAGEYVLILEATADRLFIGNIRLFEAEDTVEAYVPFTFQTAPRTFDFELYNQSYWNGKINGDYEKYSKVDYYINQQYAAGHLNWKIDSFSKETEPRFVINQGLRIKTNPGNYVAIRFRITEAGTYNVDLNSSHNYNFGAKTWIAPAAVFTTSDAVCQVLMTDANAKNDISLCEEVLPAQIGQCEFMEGEYVLILEATGDCLYLGGITLSKIEGIPTPEIPDDPVVKPQYFDFELYNNSAFSESIVGDYEKYPKVKSEIEAAYDAGTLSWKLEGWTQGDPNTKLVFVKNDPSFRLSMGIDNWVAIRLKVKEAGKYAVNINGAKNATALTWLIPAPEYQMSDEEILAAMSDENAMDSVYVSVNDYNNDSNIGNYEFASGEYILIIKAITPRFYLQNISLTQPEPDPYGVATIIDGDSYRTNINWVLFTDGTLKIFGTGNLDRWFRTFDKTLVRKVVIEEGITGIGHKAFSYFSRLHTIILPDSLVCIDDWAFYNCDSLTNIYIPANVSQIADSPFAQCSNFAGIWVDENNPTYCSDASGVVYNKDMTEFVVIPTCLTSITIPDGITSIENSAFYKCTSLTSVTIPESVTRIGDAAFQNCNSLTSVSIPDSVTTIGSNAFYSCDSLTSVTIGNSVTTIGDYAFYDCDNLKVVFYKGSIAQRNSLDLGYQNYSLNYANWHYEVIEHNGGSSIIYYCGDCNKRYYPDGTEAPDFILEQLTITTLPNKLYYYIGETIDLAGLTMEGVDTEGRTLALNSGAVTQITADLSTAGRKTVTIAIPDVTVKFEIFVHEGIYTTEKVNSSLYPQSSHNYGNGLNQTKTFTHPGATSVTITFSTATYVENNYDYIYIYDGKGNEIVGYTGSSAAGRTLTIDGDTFKVRLTSDSSVTGYGYSFSSIIANMTVTNHPPVIDAATFTCTQDGLTEGSHCEICGEVLVPQKEVPALGHDFSAVFKWSDDHTACHATLSCNRQCGEVTTLSCQITTDEGGHSARVLYDGREFVDVLPCTSYTVTFADWDGSVISSGTYHYGDMISLPVDPVRLEDVNYSYTFTGWDNTVLPVCVDDATYTATYQSHCKHTNIDNGECLVCGVSFTAIEGADGNTVGYYSSLQAALKAARANQTIRICSDISTGGVALPAGVDLDLNGFTLTVKYLLAFSGSDIIDTSDDVSGLLKTSDPDGNMLSESNCQLPVYDNEAGGYRFFAIDVETCAVTGGNKYWFKIKAEKFAPLYDLINADADVQIKVKMTWDGQAEDTYAVADLSFTKTWAESYNANEDIYVTVTVDKGEGLENFKLIPMITSGGVEISGKEM